MTAATSAAATLTRRKPEHTVIQPPATAVDCRQPSYLQTSLDPVAQAGSSLISHIPLPGLQKSVFAPFVQLRLPAHDAHSELLEQL